MVFSLFCGGTGLPVRKPADSFTVSQAICTCRASGNWSGARRRVGKIFRVEILRLGVVGGHPEPLIELAELLFELGKVSLYMGGEGTRFPHGLGISSKG